MASAQTEPSMDEILASIRRIISEEDDGTPEVPVRRKLEALELTEEASGADAPEAEADGGEPVAAEAPEVPGGSDHVTEAAARTPAAKPEAEAPAPEAAPEPAAPEAVATEAAEPAKDDALDDFDPLPEEPARGEASMEPAAVAHDAGQVTDATFGAAPAEPATDAAPHPEPEAKAVSAAPAASVDAVSVAVSEAVAGQAASAFGALEENVRLSAGSGNTIEDLVQAMLRPMLKDWLEANLPRIVEDKVEEEVRRIARRR